MPLRYIAIPLPISFVDAKGEVLKQKDGTPVVAKDFVDFVEEAHLADARFGLSRSAIKSANAIRNALVGAVPGKTIAVADEDWKIWKDAAELPRYAIQGGTVEGYTACYGSAVIAQQLGAFMDAVVEASDKAPKKPVGEDITEPAPAAQA